MPTCNSQPQRCRTAQLAHLAHFELRIPQLVLESGFFPTGVLSTARKLYSASSHYFGGNNLTDVTRQLFRCPVDQNRNRKSGTLCAGDRLIGGLTLTSVGKDRGTASRSVPRCQPLDESKDPHSFRDLLILFKTYSEFYLSEMHIFGVCVLVHWLMHVCSCQNLASTKKGRCAMRRHSRFSGSIRCPQYYIGRQEQLSFSIPTMLETFKILSCYTPAR